MELIEQMMPSTPTRDEILGLSRNQKSESSNVIHKTVSMKILLSDTGKRYNRNGFSVISLTNLIQAMPMPSPVTMVPVNQHYCKDCRRYSTQWRNDWLRTNGEQIAADQAFQHISIAAPYLELMEEMTLEEFFTFISALKKIIALSNYFFCYQYIGLSHAVQKQIRYYSSGMKQRVKLAQAIFSDVPVVLLDEPCTNLDQDGMALSFISGWWNIIARTDC